jgi:hypothetical protein
MTALTRNPINTNLKQSTKFKLNFDRLPGLTYFCQSVNLPGVSASEVPRSTPFVDVYVPGEKLVYDTFNVTFTVDEDMRAWTEVHDWLRGFTFPTKFEEYVNLIRQGNQSYTRSNFGVKDAAQYSSAILTLYTNKNNPNLRIKFVGMFPISLSTVIFNTQDTAENIITADATFRFSYYDYERIAVT